MDKAIFMGIENLWPDPIVEHCVCSVDVAAGDDHTAVYYPYGYPTGKKGGKI